jgi:hypothetical protein
MDALQLDRAEFETAQAAACSRCGESLVGSYFQVNGTPHCATCTDLVRASLTGGSSLLRGLRALGAGLTAAVAGCLLYLAILWMTGYEFGLIAIVVGFAVGKAVSWGSNGRGGWRYQTMAMVLTYLAIVSAFIPMMIGAASVERENAATEVVATAPAADQAVQSPEGQSVSIGRRIVWMLLVLAIAVAVPFLQGFSNILGIVIIGIGLYEAWKLNRRQVLNLTGPHAIGAAPEPIAAP